MTGASAPLLLEYKSDLIDGIDSGVQWLYDRLGAQRQEFYRLAGADLLRLAADD